MSVGANPRPRSTGAGRDLLQRVGHGGDEQATFVLEDVGGERVTIAVETSAADFVEFLPKAQKVIDTVQWRGS